MNFEVWAKNLDPLTEGVNSVGSIRRACLAESVLQNNNSLTPGSKKFGKQVLMGRPNIFMRWFTVKQSTTIRVDFISVLGKFSCETRPG